MLVQHNLQILQYLLIILAFAWLVYAYIFLIKNAPSYFIIEILAIAMICAVGSALVAVIRRYLLKKTHSESDFNMP